MKDYDYDTYQASLPVRELGISQPLKLHQLQFFVRKPDLDVFAARLATDEQRPTVAYITAASHSGKSVSVVVGFLRSRELDFGDDARLNFTHYLYMPFANNGGNYHENIDEAELESKCGKNTKLRAALGAAYMRDCFRAQAFGRRFRRLRHLRRFLDCPAKKRHIFGPGNQEHFRFSKERKTCLRRTSPVQRARFWCSG